MVSPAAACIRFKLASSSGSWVWSAGKCNKQAATTNGGNWGAPTKNHSVNLLLKWVVSVSHNDQPVYGTEGEQQSGEGYTRALKTHMRGGRRVARCDEYVPSV